MIFDKKYRQKMRPYFCATHRLFVRKSLLFCLVLLLVSNCAVFNRNNTPLLVKVEENLIPEETLSKIAASPFYITVGILAGLIDMIIIHPAIRIPNAARDTVDALWTPSPETGYVTRMAFMPFTIILTPFFFTGDWLFRSMFDVNGNPDQSRSVSKEIPVIPDNIDIELVISQKNANEIHRWLQYKASDQDNETVRKIFDLFIEDYRLRQASFQLLSNSEQRFQKNEDFLISYLNRNRDLDYTLTYAFELRKSKAASAAMLKLVTTQKLTNEAANRYIDSIFKIKDPQHIQILLDKLRSK
ncbi:hypothetical protein CH373_05405 [Leptospira perolatii]|uniref:Uncharacterized protein n=1 Tax=Leptospira perolatii TaxID=2023191 RepID=A0A2M9ZQY6_9LEPT|nr:hypothetical protein [Leptospira perolatii]PJZ70506.1 hypothetical protein CH360_05825 [Leptospira perolatii]PJZ74343.1 hypothetical protein CH373_05405 [Leptospira perolatii]